MSAIRGGGLPRHDSGGGWRRMRPSLIEVLLFEYVLRWEFERFQ